MIRSRFAAGDYSGVVSCWQSYRNRPAAVEILQIVAKTYFYLGQNRESEAVYRELLELPDIVTSIWSQVTVDLALVLTETAQYREADSLLHLTKTSWGSDLLNRAKWLNTSGLLSLRTSQYNKAQNFLTEALRLARQTDDHETIAWSLSNLGILNREVGNYEAALSVYHEVFELDSALDKPTVMAANHLNLANVYVELNNSSEGIIHYQKALNYYQRIGDSAGISLVYGNLSEVYKGLGQYHEASEAARFAIELSQRAGDRLGEATWQLEFAELTIRLKEYSTARQALVTVRQRFRELMRPYEETITLCALSDCNMAENQWQESAACLLEAARVVDRLDRKDIIWIVQFRLAAIRDHEGRITQADSLFCAAIQTIENSREALEDIPELTTYYYESDRRAVFSNYVDFLIRHNRDTDAFAAYESSKARSLRDIIGRGAASSDAATVITYDLRESGSYVFLKKDGFLCVKRLAGQTEIDRQVLEFLSMIAHSGVASRNLSRVAEKLYKSLIAPLDSFLTEGEKLIIIPDGTLYYLPFEALASGGTYFVEHHPISYAPAYQIALALEERGKAFAAASTKNVALLVHQSYQESIGLPNLLKAQAEISRIQNVLHDDSCVVESDVPEERVKSILCSRFHIVHFIAHSRNNYDNPSQSALLFPSNKASEDGLLTTGEIAALSCSNALVVLSSCESSLGQMLRAEGMLGITRAFLSAGASGVVSSQWKVSDQSAPEFMGHFYDHLLSEGYHISSALQKAKIQLIRQNVPVYEWAPFVLWGY